MSQSGHSSGLAGHSEKQTKHQRDSDSDAPIAKKTETAPTGTFIPFPPHPPSTSWPDPDLALLTDERWQQLSSKPQQCRAALDAVAAVQSVEDHPSRSLVKQLIADDDAWPSMVFANDWRKLVDNGVRWEALLPRDLPAIESTLTGHPCSLTFGAATAVGRMVTRIASQQRMEEYLSDAYTGRSSLLDRIKANDAVMQEMLRPSAARPEQTNLERLMLTETEWEELLSQYFKEGKDKVDERLRANCGLTARAALAVVSLVESGLSLSAYLKQRLGPAVPAAPPPFMFEFASRTKQVAEYCEEVLMPRYQLFRTQQSDKSEYAAALCTGNLASASRACLAISFPKRFSTSPSNLALTRGCWPFWDAAPHC